MSAFSIEPPDRVAITKGLASLYEFSGSPRDRRVLLAQAGLGRFISTIDLSGAALTVAGDLVSRLEDYGTPLPEQPSKYPLGALLSYVVELSDVPPESKRVYADVIVKYVLVSDADYIEKLRRDYSVTLEPVRDQDQQFAAPPRGVTEASEPLFKESVKDDAGLETIISSEDNFLDVQLLSGALYCAQAVCRIESPVGRALGTGVLIGPDLLLTNQHVLKNKDYLQESVARFDYKILDGTGVASPGRVVKLQSDFYHSSSSEDLDYALVRTKGRPLEKVAALGEDTKLTPRELLARGKHRGFLQVAPRFIREHERVNVIQHPNGDPLKVVMTRNYVVVDMTETRVQYIADTMEGSSGSPVFNQNWELIALHHSGKPYPPESAGDSLKKIWKGRFRVNEGIPIRAILEDFKQKGLDHYLPQE